MAWIALSGSVCSPIASEGAFGTDPSTTAGPLQA
jgi:hypothetical protein